MTDRKSTQHLLEDIVQVAARCDRRDIRLKPLLLLDRIHAMEVRIVEVGSFHSPHLVIHLLPLGRGIDTNLQVRQRYHPFTRLYRSIGRHDHISWSSGSSTRTPPTGSSF